MKENNLFKKQSFLQTHFIFGHPLAKGSLVTLK